MRLSRDYEPLVTEERRESMRERSRERDSEVEILREREREREREKEKGEERVWHHLGRISDLWLDYV